MPRQYIRRICIYVIGPSIAYLPLTKNQFSLIDTEDSGLVEDRCWQAVWMQCAESFYVQDSKGLGIHRHILKAPIGKFVDHKNCNPLDNRKCNLRLCTRQQNSYNKRSLKKTTLGLKGAYRIAGCATFRAKIRFNGKLIHLGNFATPEEAHQAYQQAAQKYGGEFARFG